MNARDVEANTGSAPIEASPAAAADPIMAAITLAVADGRAGEIAAARLRLTELWSTIGVDGDPLHRCTLAHYLADLQPTAAEALIWDTRALDAADMLTDRHVRDHHPGLDLAGFYPSLHLNLADNLRQLGAFDAARERITSARSHESALADDPYGRLIRTAIAEVSAAVDRRDVAPRPGSRQ